MYRPARPSRKGMRETGMDTDITTSNSITTVAAQIRAEHEKTNDQPKTWETYVHDINAAWRKAVDSIIETGRILLEAKDGPYRLKHGAFEAMVRTELPFNERTGQMLMRIARHPILSDAKHVSLLPPKIGTRSDFAANWGHRCWRSIPGFDR